MKRALFFACLLPLVACQATADETNREKSGEGYSVSDFSDRNVAFEKAPERIAVLGNGELDIVYALGSEVIGRPSSNEPSVIAEAEDAVQVGTSHEVDLERLTYANPDLVLANAPMNEKDIPTFEGAGAEVLLTSANSIQDIMRQIELIGETLLKTDEAEELTSEIDERLSELNSDPLHNEPKVLLVYGAPGSNLAALPNSLGGDLLEAAGGINVAASFEQLQEFPQYAALSPERIIEANPDIVLFMAHGDPTAVEDSFIREMEQHAGWSQLPAVQEGRLDVLPADLFGTNPGTRIIDALEHMRELLEEVGADE